MLRGLAAVLTAVLLSLAAACVPLVGDASRDVAQPHAVPAAREAPTIGKMLSDLYGEYGDLDDGVPYTSPGLKAADPHAFGIAIATVDADVHTIGDAEMPFAIQSISKAFLYGLALEDHGREALLEKVGVNATGLPFTSIMASDARAPLPGRDKALQNPMVSAGAIATASLISGATEHEKWSRTQAMFARYAGHPLLLNERVYEAELAHSSGSLALAHLFHTYGMLYAAPRDTVARYLKGTSLNITARDLAIMGATLANGGINPVTNERAVEERYVQNILSAMVTAGLYDGSGRWFFNVGLPAKSGVGGGLLVVAPGRFGMAVYSPPLDSRGNSVRGLRVAHELSQRWSLHLLAPAKQE